MMANRKPETANRKEKVPRLAGLADNAPTGRRRFGVKLQTDWTCPLPLSLRLQSSSPGRGVRWSARPHWVLWLEGSSPSNIDRVMSQVLTQESCQCSVLGVHQSLWWLPSYEYLITVTSLMIFWVGPGQERSVHPCHTALYVTLEFYPEEGRGGRNNFSQPPLRKCMDLFKLFCAIDCLMSCGHHPLCYCVTWPAPTDTGHDPQLAVSWPPEGGALILLWVWSLQ